MRCTKVLRVVRYSALSAVAWMGPGGCGFFVTPFPEGTYSADVPCTLTVGEGSNEESTSFTTPVTLVVSDSRELSLNGVPVVEGERITFTTPTADLTFEIVYVYRLFNTAGVRMVPRPTLPGITVDGPLFQRFDLDEDVIHTFASATLDVMDASGTTRLRISCDGTLTRN